MWFLDFQGPWYEIAAEALVAVLAVVSAGHALINKRDPRAALGWIAVCLAIPGLGALLYWSFGVNFIKTRARKLRAQAPIDWGESVRDTAPVLEVPEGLPAEYLGYLEFSHKVTKRRLVGGNAVAALHNGEEAFPAMLAAIAGARRSVHLCSYIFDADETGRQFVKALAAAQKRGVEVKVLVDDVGERYSRPRISALLRQAQVPVARFLPLSFTNLHLNLRTHRKMLVVDGCLAFTGGMNIGDRHLAADPGKKHRVADMQFRVDGPVVQQIEEAFLEDWSFATGREAEPPPAVEVPEAGDLICRGITDGPNEDYGKLQWILIGAINAARERIRIMTPYFLPDRELIAVLNAADMRGVEVQIILPQQSNLPYVHWATRAMLWQLIKHGVEVFYQPPPFAHTKLFIVDRTYCLIGSANLDARSLRLNFEYNLEVLGDAFGERMIGHFDGVRDRSRPVTLEEMDGRSVPVRLRDSFCHLFSPYL